MINKKIAFACVTVWRSIFTLASCSLCLHAFCASRSRKFSKKKKCVSIDSKCSETHRNAKKKNVYPFGQLRVCRSIQSTDCDDEVEFHLNLIKSLVMICIFEDYSNSLRRTLSIKFYWRFCFFINIQEFELGLILWEILSNLESLNFFLDDC